MKKNLNFNLTVCSLWEYYSDILNLEEEGRSNKEEKCISVQLRLFFYDMLRLPIF